MDEKNNESGKKILQLYINNKNNNNTKSKLYTSIKNSIKKGKNIINEKKSDNKSKVNNNDFKRHICFTEKSLKSSEINKNKKKLFFSQIKKIKSNRPDLSNGEVSDNHNNRYRNNYDTTKKKLLILTKKDNNNINKEKINITKNDSKSQTLKNINNIIVNDNNNNLKNNEERIKENNNLFNKYALRRKTSKSKTTFQHFIGKIEKNSYKSFRNRQEQEWNTKNIIKLNTLKSENLEEPQNFNLFKDKKSDFSNYSKNENSYMNHLNTISNTTNYQFPSLELYKPTFTEKMNNFGSQKSLRKTSITRNKNEISSIKKNKNLYKSVKIKESNYDSLIMPNKYLYNPVNNNNINNINSIKENLYFIPKESLGKGNYFFFKQNKYINNNALKKFSKFYRKQTFNIDDRENNDFNKLLEKNKSFNINKNNFMKKLKKELKLEHPTELIKDWVTDKKKELELSSLSFIKNKINIWTCRITNNLLEDDQNIIFNGEESKYNIIKEQKYIRRIVKEYLKRITSPNDISRFYFSYHKGLLENNILIYIKKNFFEISLPSYLFVNNNKKLTLNKNKKTLLRQKTIGHRNKRNSNQIIKISPKRGRRLSCVDKLRTRNENLINNDINIVDPSEDIKKKKYILYFYNLDIDLDNNNNNLENNEKFSFLGILRNNLNNPKNQELLINNFYNRYYNGTAKSNHIFFNNKKNSINNIINKGTNDSLKSNKISFFKNNFFSRNEIMCSSNKLDDINVKKSLLEYNLLFDPSLTGYNNMVTDTDIIFEPKIERTIINKKKRKEIIKLKNRQINSLLFSSGGMKTDKNIIVMKTLDLKNKYNYKHKGNINSLTSSIKDCNYESFVKYYRLCNCGPNAIDNDGYSLLSLAVKSSCLEIVSFLLDEKANPNLQNVIIYYIILYIFYYYRNSVIHRYMRL